MICFSRFIALMVVLTAAPVCAQEAPNTLNNLDFETGAPGEAPPGWSFPQPMRFQERFSHFPVASCPPSAGDRGGRTTCRVEPVRGLPGETHERKDRR